MLRRTEVRRELGGGVGKRCKTRLQFLRGSLRSVGTPNRLSPACQRTNELLPKRFYFVRLSSPNRNSRPILDSGFGSGSTRKRPREDGVNPNSRESLITVSVHELTMPSSGDCCTYPLGVFRRSPVSFILTCALTSVLHAWQRFAKTMPSASVNTRNLSSSFTSRFHWPTSPPDGP